MNSDRTGASAPGAPLRAPQEDFPLIGREAELLRLRDALRDRRSLLILGSPGIGKSRLLDALCSEPPDDAAPIRIRYSTQPHQLLVGLARQLLKNGHKRLAASLRCSPEAVDRESSVHLRGILRRSLALEPCPLILEDIRDASAPVYRFLQALYHTPGIPIIATAISPWRMGFLHRLFWDPRERLEVSPLRDHDARRLASFAAERFRLAAEIDRTGLQEKVLAAAAGNPGRIMEMYRLAADPRYHRGEYVKMALIRIDLAARFTA